MTDGKVQSRVSVFGKAGRSRAAEMQRCAGPLHDFRCKDACSLRPTCRRNDFPAQFAAAMCVVASVPGAYSHAFARPCTRT
eukprot:2620032-Rhodomonas_salina.1